MKCDNEGKNACGPLFLKANLKSKYPLITPKNEKKCKSENLQFKNNSGSIVFI